MMNKRYVLFVSFEMTMFYLHFVKSQTFCLLLVNLIVTSKNFLQKRLHIRFILSQRYINISSKEFLKGFQRIFM